MIEENAIRKECNIHGWSVEQLQAAVELERGPMRFLLQVKLEPDPTSDEVDQAIEWIEKRSTYIFKKFSYRPGVR